MEHASFVAIAKSFADIYLREILCHTGLRITITQD